MADYVKFQFNDIDGIGRVTEQSEGSDNVVVQFPGGGTAEFKADELTEITEDEYKEGVVAVVDTVLAELDPERNWNAINKCFDDLFEVSERMSEMEKEVEAKNTELARVTEDFASLLKKVMSEDRFAEISEINDQAWTVLSEDETEAKASLGTMDEDEYEKFKTMATKFTKLSERTETSLPKSTDQTQTSFPKTTDFTASDEVLDNAEADEGDNAEDVDASAQADEGGNELEEFKAAVASVFFSGKNGKE